MTTGQQTARPDRLHADELTGLPLRSTMNLLDQALAVAFLLTFGHTAHPAGPCISLLGHVLPLLLNGYVLVVTLATLAGPPPRRWTSRAVLLAQAIMSLALMAAILYSVTTYTLLYHYRGLVRL